MRLLPLAVLLSAMLPLSAHAITVKTIPPYTKPACKSQAATHVDLVFVLDTTGSMGGLIQGAKTKIWRIVNDVMQNQRCGADVRVGLIAYRDKEDEYVTRKVRLNQDLDEVYAELMSFKAAGGGDEPEHVRLALHEAVNQMNWRPNSKKVLFLVGDAPPKDSYIEVPSVSHTAQKAKQKGIIINTLLAGDSKSTAKVWQSVAQYGGGITQRAAFFTRALAVALHRDRHFIDHAGDFGGRLPEGFAGFFADAARQLIGAALEAGSERFEYAQALLERTFGPGRKGLTRRLDRLEHLFGILSADRDTRLQDILDKTRRYLPEQVVTVLVGEAFGRLDALAQQVMQALASCRYPVPPAAIDYLLHPHVPGIDSAPVLARLYNMQFVRRDAGRYHLHQIDRDYALDRLAPGSAADRAGEPPPLTRFGLRHRAACRRIDQPGSPGIGGLSHAAGRRAERTARIDDAVPPAVVGQPLHQLPAPPHPVGTQPVGRLFRMAGRRAPAKQTLTGTGHFADQGFGGHEIHPGRPRKRRHQFQRTPHPRAAAPGKVRRQHDELHHPRDLVGLAAGRLPQGGGTGQQDRGERRRRTGDSDDGGGDGHDAVMLDAIEENIG